MIVSAIAAIGNDAVIGREGKLPWHLPDDLKLPAITWGKPIIMGRKTHESLGRALPGRTNIVLTRSPAYRAEGCVVVSSLTECYPWPVRAERRKRSSSAAARSSGNSCLCVRRSISRPWKGNSTGTPTSRSRFSTLPIGRMFTRKSVPQTQRNPFRSLYRILVRQYRGTSKNQVGLLPAPRHS